MAHQELTRLLTTRQVADHLSVREATLVRWRKTRTGPPYVKVGRAVRYRPVDVDNFVRARVLSDGDVYAWSPRATAQA